MMRFAGVDFVARSVVLICRCWFRSFLVFACGEGEVEWSLGDRTKDDA